MLSHQLPGLTLCADMQLSPGLDAANLLASLPDAEDPSHLTHSTPIELHSAYITCENITRTHSKSFFLSSQLLPPEKRRAVRALYAFCRTSDDLVDNPAGDAACALARWVRMVRSPQPNLHHPVLYAWHDTAQRYAIPQSLVDELLAGIAMDLTITRYASFADLWIYCYRVASVVGLLAMQIIGYQDGATEYAVKLGVALQLTNILRDVGEDARRGRIYLPLDELQAFQLAESDILHSHHSPQLQALLETQIRRAEQLYDESWPGIRLLSADSRLAISAAGAIYRGILGRIRRNHYDVFHQRASVPLWEKLLILWRVRRRLAHEHQL